MSTTVNSQDLLHPSGTCTCGREGQCAWCNEHCQLCGTEASNEIHHQRLCGQLYGREILLSGLSPGEGIQAVCLLELGHEGDHGRYKIGPHPFTSIAEATEACF